MDTALNGSMEMRLFGWGLGGRRFLPTPLEPPLLLLGLHLLLPHKLELEDLLRVEGEARGRGRRCVGPFATLGPAFCPALRCGLPSRAIAARGHGLRLEREELLHLRGRGMGQWTADQGRTPDHGKIKDSMDSARCALLPNQLKSRCAPGGDI